MNLGIPRDGGMPSIAVLLIVVLCDGTRDVAEPGNWRSSATTYNSSAAVLFHEKVSRSPFDEKRTL